MGDFEDRLSSLLSDPDTMAQVMKLAQSLSGGNDSPAENPPPSQNTPDPGAVLSQFTSSLDPQLLARLLPLLAQANRSESSETSAFLYALRPFLRESRRDKVERAAQLAKMIHLAKVFFMTKEE